MNLTVPECNNFITGNTQMTKSDAIDLLGGSVAEAARQLHTTRFRINGWPDKGELPTTVNDQIRGAHARINEERDKKATFYMYKSKA